MNLGARLSKLEYVTGIGKPCEWCAHWTEQQRIFFESLEAQGVKLHQPGPDDVTHAACCDCGIMRHYDRTLLTKADRRAWDALRAEEKRESKEGRETNAAWLWRYLAAVDRENDAWRKFYGEAFDIARKETDHERLRQFILEMAEEAQEAEEKERATL